MKTNGHLEAFRNSSANLRGFDSKMKESHTHHTGIDHVQHNGTVQRGDCEQARQVPHGVYIIYKCINECVETVSLDMFVSRSVCDFMLLLCIYVT